MNAAKHTTLMGERAMTKAREAKQGSSVFKVGCAVFVRTVTYHLLGRVNSVADGFVELKEASWIADSGRFHQAITTGVLAEVEPVGIVYVAIASIVDVFPWVHDLPAKQK